MRALVEEEKFPMRVGFVIENHLGHRALMSNLRAAFAGESAIDPIWLPLEPTGGLLDRIPHVKNKHALIFGVRARRALAEAEAAGRLDACFMHTQRMAHLVVDRMRKLPTFLSIDATPLQLDRHYRTLLGLRPQHGTRYYKMRDAIHRRTYGAARGMITMSQAVAGTLSADYGVDEKDVLVLWPGVDTAKWSPDPTRRQGDEYRLLFVGGDFVRKGGDLLLRWVRATKRRDFRVDIVTEQPLDDVPPNVHVHTKFRPNEPGLLELAREADLLLLPTRADMSPWVVSEAKAAGVPVLSTRVGAIPELVRDGVDGWLVAPEEYEPFAARLEAVLADRQQIREFGARARADAVERLDSVKNAQRLIAFMQARI
jgi:glycosyltransferase involved in cell wall biosynthesis